MSTLPRFSPSFAAEVAAEEVKRKAYRDAKYQRTKVEMLESRRLMYASWTAEQKEAKVEYNRQWRLKNREMHKLQWTKSNSKNLKGNK